MKQKDNENGSLLHCRNCDGYYDPSLPNCPHCGEETANNLSAGEESALSIADYGGGFGTPGSTISKVAALLAGVLGAVALISLAVLGLGALSNMSFSTGDTSAEAVEDPADTSAPADASAEASASAQPEQKEDESEQEEQEVVSPEEIALNYFDVTLPNSGETLLLEVSISPSDWEGDVTFTTDNKNVATITAAGLITNVGAGECNITVSAGKTSVTCVVRCKGGSDATEGGSATVTGTYSGGKLAGSDEASEQQKEKEKQEQEEKEEQEAEEKEKQEKEKEQEEEEGKKKEASSSITLEYYDITLVHVGDGYTFSPSGGNGTYSWSSGNSSVASVTSGGTVTATGVGETTITCTSGDVSVQVIVRVSGQ